MLKTGIFSVLSLALFVIACACDATDSQPRAATTEAMLVPEAKKDVGQYEWVDEEQADIILVAEFSFPRLEGHDSHRFGLRRIEPGTPRSNETRLPSGFAGDGPSGGHGGSIGIMDPIPNDGKVIIIASISWNFKDKSEGKFKGEISVPWMGEP